MITIDEAHTLGGCNLIGSNGDKIGVVSYIFLNDQTGLPEWITVSTRYFGDKETLVPLSQAQVAGEDLFVPYEKDVIEGAPNIGAELYLSEVHQRELYDYYGLP